MNPYNSMRTNLEVVPSKKKKYQEKNFWKDFLYVYMYIKYINLQELTLRRPFTASEKFKVMAGNWTLSLLIWSQTSVIITTSPQFGCFTGCNVGVLTSVSDISGSISKSGYLEFDSQPTLDFSLAVMGLLNVSSWGFINTPDEIIPDHLYIYTLKKNAWKSAGYQWQGLISRVILAESHFSINKMAANCFS